MPNIFGSQRSLGVFFLFFSFFLCSFVFLLFFFNDDVYGFYYRLYPRRLNSIFPQAFKDLELTGCQCKKCHLALFILMILFFFFLYFTKLRCSIFTSEEFKKKKKKEKLFLFFKENVVNSLSQSTTSLVTDVS